MMVFTYGSQETIKLDLKFPRVANRQNDEYYELRWRNTHSQEISYDQVTEGPYRHELSVDESMSVHNSRRHIRTVFLLQDLTRSGTFAHRVQCP
jgi:hypothetical protein